MSRLMGRLLGGLATCALYASSALASSIPIGYVSWDVDIPKSVGRFDISNLTGGNSSPFPTPDFPITTPVSLSGLSLTVHFTGGGTSTFGSSYFTLSLDGLSFNGGDIAIGGSNPLPTDATLTGSFSPTSIMLNDGSTATILSSFSATVLPSSGATLADGDLAIISAQTTTSGGTVPEPGTLLLAGLAVLALRMSSGKRARRANAAS